jgi:hypothetical protein
MRSVGIFLVLMAALAAVPSVAGAVTLEGARAKALKATRAERGHGGVILFGLRAPVRGFASIREAGRRPPPAGLSTRTMPGVMTAGRHRQYFFYLDRGAYQAYEHPGRVILVDAVTGQARRSRTLRFAPVIDGRLPVFLRSREGYELPAYRVDAKDYAVGGAARAASAGPGPFGARAAAASAVPRSAASEALVASRLAAEKSCTVAVGARRSDNLDTLGSTSGAPVLPLLVYNQSGRTSLAAFVRSEAIDRRGCRDILIAISGDGYRSLAPPSTRTGLLLTSGRRMLEYHVNLAALRSIIASNPSVSFKLMLDGPGSGAYLDPLKSLSNVLLIATSSSAGQTAYRYLPQKLISGNLARNPLRRRADSSFLTTQLFGAAAFAASDAEVLHAATEVAAGRAPSFLAYMIARGFTLSRPFDFTADLGATQRLYTRFPVTPPGPTNRPPVALSQSVTTTEDTPRSIVLGATDPDGNPLTFTVGAPAHGTLSGTAPNLTYTPAAGYDGADSFTFSVSDGSLSSAAATVSITVTAVDDPPVTTASGTLAYTENDPPTAIAPALTVTDADSANLTGATAQITGNHVAADDLLALPVQPGITAVFDAPTGMLTLSGSATVAAYQAALRAVTYANSSDDPGNAPRTVTFKSRDAGGFGRSAARTITIAPVNDGPTDIALSNASVAENLPAGSTVGSLSDVDPEAADSTTFSLVAGAGSTDNTSFQVSGSTLQTNAVFDFETKSSYSIRIRVTDGGGLTFEEQFTITVTNVDESPTDLDLSPSTLAENEPVNTVVGALTATDPDAGDTFTFTLVGGTGSGDNGSFNVSGGSLRTSASFDFETKSSYAIRVRASDAGGLFFEEALTVTVTNVNDPPTDIALSNATVDENVPSGSLVGMLSGTDQDPLDTLTFSLVGGAGSTDNAQFQVSGTMLQTAAVFDFEAKSSYAIRLRVSDGNGGTFEEQFTISVTDVNDAPTNIALSPSSVDEGQPAATPVGTLSATDQDLPADTFTFTLVAGAGSTDNASFQIVGNTLQTAAVLFFNDGATRSIRVSVSDGDGGTFEKQLTVTVNDQNLSPTNIALTPSSVAENAAIDTVVGTLSATDPDVGDTFTFTLVSGAGSTDNAFFNIAGSSLRTSVAFDFEAQSTFSIRVGVSDGHGGTFEKALTVTVTDANDPPTDIALSNASVAENQAPGAPVGNLTSADQDAGATHTYTLVAGTGSDDNTKFQIVGGVLQTAQSLDFEATPTLTVRIRTTDNGGLFFEKQFTITVTDANDAPTDILLSNAGVPENQPVATMVGTLSDVDPDVGDSAAFTLVAGPGSADNGSFQISGTTLQTNAMFDFETKSSYSIRVRVTDGGGLFFEEQVTITVTNVNEAPTNVALTPSSVPENQPVNTVVGALSATDPDTGDTHTFTLVTGTGDADNGSFNILGGSLRTSAAFDFEVKSSYAIRVRGTDAGGLFFEKELTVTVTNVNEAPTDIALSNASVDENTPAGTPVGTLSSTDPDVGATHTYTLVAGTGDDHNAKFQIVGNQLQRSAAVLDFETTPTVTVRIRTTDNGGLFFEKQFTITVINVNEAPVADDESFSGAIGNTTFVSDDPSDGPPATPDPSDTAPGASRPHTTITGDILAGDTDVDGPGPLTVAIPGPDVDPTTPGVQRPSNDGGTVTLEPDGDFTFEPADGTSCSDTSDFFDYTVSDGGSPVQSDVGRVTIAITGCVLYVNNDDAEGNNGTSAKPFDTLAQAQSVTPANGFTIYVEDGNNTTAGLSAGIDLKANQRLIGEAAALTIGADTLQPAIPAKRPTITDTAADAVALSSGNTVRGIEIDPEGGSGIAGDAGDAGGTIDDVRIIDAGTPGSAPELELDGTSGTFDISDLTVDPVTPQTAVRLNNNSGVVNFQSAGTISITNDGAKALDVTGTNMGANSVFDDITVTNSSTGGVSMVNTTGTTTFGDGSGTDLDLQTTSGTNAGFLLSNAGNVTVPAGGIANVSATGGPAVDVSGTSGASLAFDDVDSTNSAGAGVSISGLGGGTFGANGSSLISNATGIDFDLNGGTGAVTYDGAIADNAGQLVRVQNTSNGIKDFNGAISGLAGAAGGNVGLSSNTGATIRFDGGVKLASTGATSALSATGGGTLAVTDPASSNNTLGTTTSTGQALNVVNTTISADDLTFESIRSSTASNGIVLNNTANATGRLVVTGAGGTCSSAANCSGGAIQSSTGAGIALTSVPGGASLTRMAVTSGGDDGIRATTVNDVDLADSVVLNNGNSHTVGAEERGLDYLDVTGTPEILRTTVSGSDDSNAHIRNTVAGTTALNVNQSTFSDSKFNAGLRLRGEGPSVMNATVTADTFSLNADPGFSMQTDSSNTAQQTLLFDNNDVSGGSANAVSNRPQVSINADGASTVKTSVTNNDIKSGAGAEIILNTLANHTGTFDAKVNGNDINDAQPGALDPLADGGSAIWGWAHGDGVTRMEIRNNNVSNWGGRGMELTHNDGTGHADYTVTGNVLSTPDVSPNTFEGIYIASGGAAGDTSDVCVDMENNDMDGIGRQGVSDIALDRFTGNVLRFADFNDTSVPNLQTNLRGKNPASPALTVETFSFGPTATAATACNLPVGTP